MKLNRIPLEVCLLFRSDSYLIESNRCTFMYMKIILFLIVVLCYQTFVLSQATLVFPINNIYELIQNGSVTVNHSAFDIGSIQDVFDDNFSSLARTANINPMVITLIFPYSVSFSGSEILQTYGNGWWTLEAADSESDLSGQTGSYVQLFSMSPLVDGVTDSKSFQTPSKHIIRLTVRRTTGDDYVHLNEWKLLGATAQVEITSICMRPSQFWMLPASSLGISLYGTDEQGISYPIHTDIQWTIENQELI